MYLQKLSDRMGARSRPIVRAGFLGILSSPVSAADNSVVCNTAAGLLLNREGHEAAEHRSSGGASAGATDAYLSVTDAKSGEPAAVVFDDLDNGLFLKALTFECDFRSGAGTGQLVDGFSLDYGRVRCSRFAGTAGETNLPEEGSLTGLCIGFGTWQSSHHLGGIRNVGGINIRIEGQLLTQLLVSLDPATSYLEASTTRLRHPGEDYLTTRPHCPKNGLEDAGEVRQTHDF